MTYAQWLWEYEAARKKEEDEVDTVLEVLKLLRITLIKLLGLDLLADKSDKSIPAESLFTPLSIMISRREVVDIILKKLEEETVVQKAMSDDEFERMSSAIARGEDIGDMEPMVDDVQQDTVNELLRREELEALGIKMVDGPINAIHIKMDNTAAISKSNDMIRELNAARRSVDKQIKEENLKATIRFDEEENA